MATITVWLFIESADLTAEEISLRIGLRPDASWKIGDTRGKTGKVYETNSWSLESQMESDENPLTVGENVRVCLSKILSRIQNHADQFKAVASGRTAGLYIGISADEAPALELRSETIREIGTLGVDLQLDLMV